VSKYAEAAVVPGVTTNISEGGSPTDAQTRDVTKKGKPKKEKCP
jgi:hypothetical protein